MDKTNYSFVFDVIPNPPIRTGPDFKSALSDPASPSPRTGSNCADLKSSPVLTVGFEILHKLTSGSCRIFVPDSVPSGT